MVNFIFCLTSQQNVNKIQRGIKRKQDHIISDGCTDNSFQNYVYVATGDKKCKKDWYITILEQLFALYNIYEFH